MKYSTMQTLKACLVHRTCELRGELSKPVSDRIAYRTDQSIQRELQAIYTAEQDLVQTQQVTN